MITGALGKASPVQTPAVGSKVTDKVTEEERRELLSREKVVIADNAKTAVDISEKSDMIKSEEVGILEQAKKRDHKIYINDVVNKTYNVVIPCSRNKFKNF